MTTTTNELGEREEKRKTRQKKRKEKPTGHGFAPATIFNYFTHFHMQLSQKFHQVILIR
jgi:hypothetical protein